MSIFATSPRGTEEINFVPNDSRNIQVFRSPIVERRLAEVAINYMVRHD